MTAAATGLSSSDSKQMSLGKTNKQINNNNNVNHSDKNIDNKSSDTKQQKTNNNNKVNKNDETREFIEVNCYEFDNLPHPTDRMSSL